MADRNPKVVLKEAIAAFKAIRADVDVDQALADEANTQITVLGTKLQETAFDNMDTRTQGLQTLMTALDAVAAKADHKDASQSIVKVRGLLGEAKGYYDTAKGMFGK